MACGWKKFFCATVVLFAFFIGFGLFEDAYSGYRKRTEDKWIEYEFCKDKVCMLDYERNQIQDKCMNYCDDRRKAEDNYDAYCDSVGFRKVTKGFNIAAFILAFIGAVWVFVANFFTLPPLIPLLGSIMTVFGMILADFTIQYYGVENMIFLGEAGIGFNEYTENIFFSSYYLVSFGAGFGLFISVIILSMNACDYIRKSDVK